MNLGRRNSLQRPSPSPSRGPQKDERCSVHSATIRALTRVPNLITRRRLAIDGGAPLHRNPSSSNQTHRVSSGHVARQRTRNRAGRPICRPRLRVRCATGDQEAQASARRLARDRREGVPMSHVRNQRSRRPGRELRAGCLSSRSCSCSHSSRQSQPTSHRRLSAISRFPGRRDARHPCIGRRERD